MTPVHHAASTPLFPTTQTPSPRRSVQKSGGFSQQLAQASRPSTAQTQKSASPGRPAPTPTPTPTLAGDVDGNGIVNSDDATALLQYLFQGGPAPQSQASMDANGDGNVDLADVVRILQSLSSQQNPNQIQSSR